MSDTILVFETAGTWQLVLSLGVIGAALFLASMGLRGYASAGRRYFLLSLRFMVLLLLGVLLLGPALQHRILTPLKSRLALLVDGSQSMGIREGEGTRSGRVASYFSDQRGNLEKLATRYALETYTFSDKPRPVAIGSVGTESGGQRTDLVAALPRSCRW